MASVMAIVSKAIFEKEHGKKVEPGQLLDVDKYWSKNKGLSPLEDGGDLYLVTVRSDEPFLVGVLRQPRFTGDHWAAKRNVVAFTSLASVIRDLRFTSGKGVNTAPGKLGMSLQTPRTLTDDDIALLLGVLGSGVKPVAKKPAAKKPAAKKARAKTPAEKEPAAKKSAKKVEGALGLQEILDKWRETKWPILATMAERLSEQEESDEAAELRTAPVIKQDKWLAALERFSEVDRGALAATLGKGSTKEVKARVNALCKLGPDPRVVRALLEIVPQPIWTSTGAGPVWTAIYKALEAMPDPRTIAMFEAHDTFTDDRIEKVVAKLRKLNFDGPDDATRRALEVQLKSTSPQVAALERRALDDVAREKPRISARALGLDRPVSVARANDRLLVGLTPNEEDTGLDRGDAALGIGLLPGAIAMSPSGERFASFTSEDERAVLSITTGLKRTRLAFDGSLALAVEFFDDDTLAIGRLEGDDEIYERVDANDLFCARLARGPRLRHMSLQQSARLSDELLVFVTHGSRGSGLGHARVLNRERVVQAFRLGAVFPSQGFHEDPAIGLSVGRIDDARFFAQTFTGYRNDLTSVLLEIDAATGATLARHAVKARERAVVSDGELYLWDCSVRYSRDRSKKGMLSWRKIDSGEVLGERAVRPRTKIIAMPGALALAHVEETVIVEVPGGESEALEVATPFVDRLAACAGLVGTQRATRIGSLAGEKFAKFRASGSYDASVAVSAGVLGVLSAGSLELRRGRKKFARVSIDGVQGDSFAERFDKRVVGAHDTCAFFAEARTGVAHVVVEGDDAKIAKTLPVKGDVEQIACTGDAVRALVATQSELMLFDVVAGLPMAVHELARAPSHIALHADGVSAFVIDDGELSCVDLQSQQVRALGNARAVAAHPTRAWWAVLRPDGVVQLATSVERDPEDIGAHIADTRALAFAGDALVVGGQRASAPSLETIVTYDFGVE